MPFPWAAALGAVGSGISALTGNSKKARHEQWITNERNIEFQQQQNLQNKKWADESWDKTNAYNTPAMQMQRFKEAGLNPHLIYGNGSEVSQQPATSGKAPEAQNLPIDTTAQEIGQMAFNGVQSYVANRLQQAQVNNLEKAQQVMDAQIVNTQANTSNTLASTANTKQQTSQSAQLWSNTVASAEANLNNTNLQGLKISTDIDNTKASTNLTKQQTENAKQQITESAQRIKLLRVQGKNAEADTILKNLDINLKKQGINPQDPVWMRILGQILDSTTVTNYFKTQNQRLQDKIPWYKR